MSFDENPLAERFQLDQCIDEIGLLKQQLADAEHERDVAQEENHES